MAAQRRVLLNVSLVLAAGVLFYTLVRSQELGKPTNLLNLGNVGHVDRAGNIERTRRLEKDYVAQGRSEVKLKNSRNEKRSHTEQGVSESQRQGEEHRTLNNNPLHYGINGRLKIINGKSNMLDKSEVRKRRADPEPSAEPEASPSSEPEVIPKSEVTNPNSTTEPAPLLWPEPEPEWDTAVREWKSAWPLHVYGIASTFVLLGIVSLLELVRIHVKSRRKTALKVSLLIMIICFTTTRAVALYLDPYGSEARLDPILSRLLFSIGHPCIISAMSLLLLVLIDTTKMNVAPPTFQRVQFIIAVVFFHVVLILITDIVVAFYAKTKVLILLCQLYYLALGLIITIGYAKVGFKITRNSSANVSRDKNMEKLKILIGLASAIGFAMICVTIYGAAGVFGIYSDVMIVDPWPWWVFQTVGRVVEIVMVIVLLLMNVNVSGSGLSIRELFGKCRKGLFQNKVEVLQPNNTNSWVTHTRS